MQQELDIIAEIKSTLQKGFKISLNGIKLSKILGEGSFGCVFLGEDPNTKREIAVKICDLAILDRKTKSKTIRQIQRTLLETEGKLMRRFRSQNLVECYGVIDDKKYKVFLLELCREGDLKKYIKKWGAVPETEAIQILKQIINGLAVMHSNKIIHRDLKPENIFVNNGVFKIGDFGFARQISDQNAINCYTYLGTKYTMAPEVRNYKPYGLKADVWSVGVIFYMMICKSIAYHERYKGALDQIFNFFTVNNQLPNPLVKDFLRGCLQHDQDKRFDYRQMLSHDIFKFRGLSDRFVIEKNIEGLTRSYIIIQSQVKEIDMDKEKSTVNNIVTAMNGRPQSSKIDIQNIMESVGPEQEKKDEFQEELEKQNLNCKISQYQFEHIFKPLEKILLLDSVVEAEFMYLLVSQCFINASYALQFIRKNPKEQKVINFENQLRPFYEKIKAKQNEIYNKLFSINNSIFGKIRIKFNQIFNKERQLNKNKLIFGIQKLDYNKKERIVYIQQQANNILSRLQSSRQTKRIRVNLRAFEDISQITLANIQECPLSLRIENILNFYEI